MCNIRTASAPASKVQHGARIPSRCALPVHAVRPESLRPLVLQERSGLGASPSRSCRIPSRGDALWHRAVLGRAAASRRAGPRLSSDAEAFQTLCCLMTATKLHSAIRNPRSAGAARQAFRASHCPGAHTSIQHSSPCMAPAATRQAETAPSAVMARLWPALVAVCCVECSWSVPLPTLTLETPYTPITEHTTGPLACSVSSVEKPPPVPR